MLRRCFACPLAVQCRLGTLAIDRVTCSLTAVPARCQLSNIGLLERDISEQLYHHLQTLIQLLCFQ